MTIVEACRRLGISRGTATRWLKHGRLRGTKKHHCGAVCADPAACGHTAVWDITEDDVRQALAPSETGR